MRRAGACAGRASGARMRRDARGRARRHRPQIGKHSAETSTLAKACTIVSEDLDFSDISEAIYKGGRPAPPADACVGHARPALAWCPCMHVPARAERRSQEPPWVPNPSHEACKPVHAYLRRLEGNRLPATRRHAARAGVGRAALVQLACYDMSKACLKQTPPLPEVREHVCDAAWHAGGGASSARAAQKLADAG